MPEVISLSAFRAAKPSPAVVEKAIAKVEKEDTLDLNDTFRKAMKIMAHHTLEEVAREGLPKNSVLYLAIDCTFEGVEMSPRLREMHPENLTIMLDAWWEDLVVEDDSFTVTLNFQDVRERIQVPYAALRAFADAGTGLVLRNIPNKERLA